MHTDKKNIAEWFESEDVELRRAAVAAVNRQGDEAGCFIPQLLKIMDYGDSKDEWDKNRWVRHSAAVALGKIRPLTVKVIPDLVTYIEREGEWADMVMQGLIAWAIGRFGQAAASALPALRKFAVRDFPVKWNGAVWTEQEIATARQNALNAIDGIENPGGVKALQKTFVVEPEKKVHVMREVDVLVVGGGPAGVIAAVSAARLGARTMLVEKYAGPLSAIVYGGTAGIDNYFRDLVAGELDIIKNMEFISEDPRRRTRMIIQAVKKQGYLNQLIAGISWEFIRRLTKLGGFIFRDELEMLCCKKMELDPEVAQYGAIVFLEENDVEVLTQSLVSEPIMEGNRVGGVFIENKSGRRAILAKTVIDASGEADVAAQAGAPTVMGREAQGDVGSLLWILDKFHGEPDLPFRSGQDSANGPNPGLARVIAELNDFHFDRLLDGRDVIRYHRPGHGVFTGHNIDGADGEDVTLAELACRKYAFEFITFCRENIPGFEQCHLRQIGQQILWRGARCIVGDYVFRNQDVKLETRFNDKIFQWRGVPADLKQVSGYADAPYRMLLPRGVEGLLVAGKCASGGSVARLTPGCMAMGEAAGVAAALSARIGIMPRALDIVALQKQLREQGVLLDGHVRVVL